MTRYEEWSRAGWAAHLPGVADVPAHVASLGEATIPGLAAASADRVPDRVALEIDGEQGTHAELDAGAARVAAWLTARLGPGEHQASGVPPAGMACQIRNRPRRSWK